MIGWLRRKLLGWAEKLRFPWLLLLTAALFGIDLAIPDFIPFVDEILLGLATLVLSRLRVPRADKPSTPPM
ncbi:MAG TPA: DUF6116 family protein [Xanthomonadales bacterium]|nr:DUF6116 family protein [Xanthomonadales bacterium]